MSYSYNSNCNAVIKESTTLKINMHFPQNNAVVTHKVY